jgi:hypothetical protein
MRHQDETGDAAAQVEERMELDGALGAAEVRPGKQFQAQVDRGRIEGLV